MSISRTSRTSTDVRFRRGLIGTIVVLALACAGLGTASTLQGPKVQAAQLELATAVTAPASLRLFLDEAVADVAADEVRVEPDVPHTVSTDGDVVLVHFEQALRYGTRYAVNLAGVTARAGGASADLEHSFRTPEAVVRWVQRDTSGDGSGDRVVEAAPGAEPTEVLAMPHIQDFLSLPEALFTVTLNDGGDATAQIVSLDGSNREDLTLPGAGQISLLEYSGTTVLFTFTNAGEGVPEYDDTLFRLDLSGTHLSDVVVGLDGAPMSVDRLIPIPGTTQVLVHQRSGDLLRLDTSTSDAPVLVASYTELGSLAADGHRVSAADAFGQVMYDLDDGSEERVNPSPLGGAVPYIADVIPLSGGRWLERAVLPSADFTSFDPSVALDDGTAATPLLAASGTGGVLDFRVMSNEQYLLAEISPAGADAISDRYGGSPRPLDVTLVMVDLASGEVIGEWPGSHSRF